VSAATANAKAATIAPPRDSVLLVQVADLDTGAGRAQVVLAIVRMLEDVRLEAGRVKAVRVRVSVEG